MSDEKRLENGIPSVFKRSAELAYYEIVTKDYYMLNRWSNGFFDYIIDIGTNVGIFVDAVQVKFPNAKIFAYEPCKEAFDYLQSKYKIAKNVLCVNEALGDGSDMFFCDMEFSASNQFFKEDEKANTEGKYKIHSATLCDIFDRHSIPLNSKYFLKIDCEGGERFLLDDEKAIKIINECPAFAIEVHFRTTKKHLLFPEWETYNSWIYKNFNKTHKIIYHHSRKRGGGGTYVLTKNGELHEV